MYDVVINSNTHFISKILLLYYIGGGRDTARFVRNLAKSKNGHGQDGINGQNGRKIGQNGHRTGLARLPLHIVLLSMYNFHFVNYTWNKYKSRIYKKTE